mmetsp:Transcript_24652/g.61584  ORF Transcript_24652/g.61584 Transcript_24652/m.61584 type:complete len:274 (-) Transcript_24652:1088-1909(-)
MSYRYECLRVFIGAPPDHPVLSLGFDFFDALPCSFATPEDSFLLDGTAAAFGGSALKGISSSWVRSIEVRSAFAAAGFVFFTFGGGCGPLSGFESEAFTALLVDLGSFGFFSVSVFIGPEASIPALLGLLLGGFEALPNRFFVCEEPPLFAESGTPLCFSIFGGSWPSAGPTDLTDGLVLGFSCDNPAAGLMGGFWEADAGLGFEGTTEEGFDFTNSAEAGLGFRDVEEAGFGCTDAPEAGLDFTDAAESGLVFTDADEAGFGFGEAEGADFD